MQPNQAVWLPLSFIAFADSGRLGSNSAPAGSDSAPLVSDSQTVPDSRAVVADSGLVADAGRFCCRFRRPGLVTDSDGLVTDSVSDRRQRVVPTQFASKFVSAQTL